MEERRQLPRTRIHRKAKILLDKNIPPLDCTVTDLTNHGAGLKLALNLYAPKWFELSFDNFRSSRHCSLIWQDNDKIGVSFS
jgi:hypothetical protein